MAVKFETTQKPSKPSTNLVKPSTNHPQTSQTTQKLPTNQPNHLQTSQIPDKPPTNHPKIASFFPWRHFLWLGKIQDPRTSTFATHEIQPFHPRWEEERVRCFYISARFRISLSPLHSSFWSLIADYNPTYKLLVQLQTLRNFSRRLGLTFLHWKFLLC